MPEMKRVKDPNFGEFSTPYPESWPNAEVIDKPALDQNGEVIPGKPKTSVTTKAAEKNAGAEPAATTNKEGSK